jgi:hypothetical protein
MKPNTLEHASQQPAAAPTREAKPKEKSKKKDENNDDENKKQHSRAFVVAPLPIVSPAIGSGIVPVVGYIFPFQVNDKTSPPSVVGAAGLITNNGSRGFGLGGDLYLQQTRYELKSIYLRGNVDYNLYGVGYVNENTGFKLPLNQTGQMFFIEFLRNIGWKFFLGGRFITGTSFITARPASGETAPIPPDTGLNTNLRALGVTLVRDSRPNRFTQSREVSSTSPAIFSRKASGANIRFSPTISRSTNTPALTTSRCLPTICFCVEQAVRRRSTATVYMGRATSCAATRQDAIWIATCLPRSWNTGSFSLGGSGWSPLAASAESRPERTSSARTSSSPPAAQAFAFCSARSTTSICAQILRGAKTTLPGAWVLAKPSSIW